MDLVYVIINLIFIISSGILGLILLVFPIPKADFLKNYCFSAKILASAYLLLSLANSAVLFWGLQDFKAELFKFSGIFVSASQSLIFTYGLVSLLIPNLGRRTKRLFLVHVSVILMALIGYSVIFIFYNDANINNLQFFRTNFNHPAVLLRLAFFAFYLYQILIYIKIFRKALRKHQDSLADFFSETPKLKLSWVKPAFVSALIIGLLAIVYQTVPSILFDNVLTSALIIYYIVFALNFINYNKIYETLEPAFLDTEHIDTEPERLLKKASWTAYRQKILESKIFLKEGITLVEIAQYLNVSRTTLSGFINSEENRNFNTWINEMRIEEAKKMMISMPNGTISEIARKTGFSEQSNFSRQFKQITGETPSVWKKSQTS